jgi:2-keto-4-pentenoate hydratase/2-oxohepta-3-ene-1,7-dioic acid hydratase in catechol pathway
MMIQHYLRFKSDRYPDGALGCLNDRGDVKILTGNLLDGTATPTGDTIPAAAITAFLPPVQPPNIIAIGANYAAHCKESGRHVEIQDHPLVFIKATSSLAAHGDAIRLAPCNPHEVDYEAELAVVIGRSACRVAEADAMDYVLGYTCANDVSARDVQLRMDRQWARGKSFDTFCPIGPYLATGVQDIERCRIRLFLNGELMQDQPASDMIFSIPRIIAHLSAGMTLLPGTVILTGTPSGVGMARQPPRYLREGDTVEVDIDRIGRLSNRVSAG